MEGASWLEERVRSVWVPRNGVGVAMGGFGAIHAATFMWLFWDSMNSVLARVFLLCVGVISVICHSHGLWLILKEVDCALCGDVCPLTWVA